MNVKVADDVPNGFDILFTGEDVERVICDFNNIEVDIRHKGNDKIVIYGKGKNIKLEPRTAAICIEVSE